MSKPGGLLGTSLGLMIDQCMRELAYCCDRESVINYAAMAAGVEKEELRRIVLARQTAFSLLYADH